MLVEIHPITEFTVDCTELLCTPQSTCSVIIFLCYTSILYIGAAAAAAAAAAWSIHTVVRVV